MRTVAVSMQKGGVGKTTTAAHLAAALADLEHRVLLVDLDPQCHQAELFGADVSSVGTVRDFMMTRAPLEDCVCPVRGFHLLPADPSWTDADYVLYPLMDGREKLRDGLETLSDRFDYVVLDTPPNLGALTVNALVASTDVLIPVHTANATLIDLPRFLALCDQIQKRLNPSLSILGLLPTMFARRNSEDEQVLQILRTNPRQLPCFDPVPRTTRIKSCFARQQVTLDYDRDASAAYEKLAERIAA